MQETAARTARPLTMAEMLFRKFCFFISADVRRRLMLDYSHKKNAVQAWRVIFDCSRASWKGCGFTCFFESFFVTGDFQWLLSRSLLFYGSRLGILWSGCLFDESGGEAEEVIVVVDDGGKGDAARLGDVFAQEFGGEVCHEVGADFGNLLHAHDLGSCGGSETNGVGSDFATLEGHGRLSSYDVAVLVDGDLEGGMVVGGEEPAKVVDAHGDEESAVEHGGDFGLPRTVFGAGALVVGCSASFDFPATELLAETVDIEDGTGPCRRG